MDVPDELGGLLDLILRLYAQQKENDNKPQSCLRCEDRKTAADFAPKMNICMRCLETMPQEELKYLHGKMLELRGDKK